MVQKILIATLDQKWNEKLKEKLESQGHHCVLAASGKECQLLLYRDRYDFIFLDPDIRNHSGVEVLKFVRHTQSHIKMGLIYADSKKQREYEELFNSIFSKMIFTRPFLKARPLKEIETFVSESAPATEWRLAHLFPGNPEEIKLNDKDCTPVSIEGLYGERPAFFDHYIRLKANHYVRLLPAGETMDPERLKKYSAEGVTHFYILTRIRKQFINYMNEMMRTILEERTAQATKLIGMALGLTETLLEEIQSEGLKPGIIEECKALARNVNLLIVKYPDLTWELRVDSKGKHAQTFLTMFLSQIISQNLPWVGDRTVESITLGALLRDIGLLKIPPALREKDPLYMSTPDLIRYQEHPRLGAEMLAQVPKLCPQVIQIVLQHHERISGDGYPGGLPGARIYPLAKIISLAEGLAIIITRNGLSPVDGLKNFLHDREAQAKYDPNLIRALVAGFTDEEAA